jgi:hypothetical protein
LKILHLIKENLQKLGFWGVIRISVVDREAGYSLVTQIKNEKKGGVKNGALAA